jgi:hypothetical protein
MFEELNYENLLAVDGGVNYEKIFLGAVGVVGGVAAIKLAPLTGPVVGLTVAAGVIAVVWGTYKIVDGLTE